MDDTAGAGGPTRGSEPGSLLAFLYGVAGRDELPGPVIVTLMADCGTSEAATRSLLARLRRRGDLAVSRSGRVTTYALAGSMGEAWSRGRALGEPGTGSGDADGDEGADRDAGGDVVGEVGATGDAATGSPGAGAAGRLHGILYSVPEADRAFRDALRRVARLAGYGPLRPGLVVAPRDRWDVVAAQVGPLPPGATVTPLELRMEPAHAAAAVREAWDVDALAAQYRSLRAGLDAAQRVPVTADAAGLRAFERVARPAYAAFARHPDLPGEWLPADWPAPATAEALARVVRRWSGALTSYVDTLLAQALQGTPGEPGRRS